MSKRTQESRTEEGPAVAKPRLACLFSRNLLSAKQTSSSESGASNVPGNLELDPNSVSGSTGALVQDRFQNPATSSQEWQKDNPCLRSTRTPVKSGACARSGSIGKTVQGVENQLARARLDCHILQISDYRSVDKVFEHFTQKLSIISCVLDEKTNVLIWGLLMSTTMKASVYFGPSYNDNLVAFRNTKLRALFAITQRLILEQSIEILNVSTMMWRFTPWMRSTLCHDQVIKWATAKVYVYSDSV